MPKARPPIDDFRKQRLLEWLLTPIPDREPKTLQGLADEVGMTRRQLTTWKSEADFLEEWERQYRNSVGSPERKQAVIDTLFKTATDQDDPKHVQAAGKYLEAVDAIAPQKMDITVKGGKVSELSDEQLAELMAAHAASELGQREAG
jgi:hypothetical protein